MKAKEKTPSKSNGKGGFEVQKAEAVEKAKVNDDSASKNGDLKSKSREKGESEATVEVGILLFAISKPLIIIWWIRMLK